MSFSNLALSGGALRGLSYIGCIKAFEDLHIIKDFKNLIGTSIGAFFSLMIALGINSKQLEKLFTNIDTDNLIDINMDNILSIDSNLGLDTGKRIEDFIKLILKKKFNNPNITLLELFNFTNINITFTTVNLTLRQIEYLSHLTFPNLPVYLAVRMSSSVPIFYNPVIYNNYHYIDGGVLLNYPIPFFKDQIHDTLGICLKENNNLIRPIDSFTSYISKILTLMTFQINNSPSELYYNNTIHVEGNNINFIDIHISPEDKLKLIDIGYLTTMQWFDEYLGNILFLQLNIDLETVTQKALNAVSQEIYIVDYFIT